MRDAVRAWLPVDAARRILGLAPQVEADPIASVTRSGGQPSIVLATDGRDVDLRVGGLSGTGASQVAMPDAPDRPMPGALGAVPWPYMPSLPADGQATYYDQPIVKAPPWGPAIPAYIVLGGLAGASAAFAAAGGERALGRTHLAATWLAAGSGAAGAALLMSDLGRPERALNMYRVVRPTSPMSVGAWVLGASVASSGLAAVLHGRRGALGAIGRTAGLAAGALGVPLAGYTGVLLGTSALPGWNSGIRTLPALFIGSAAATAGAALTAVSGGSTGLAVDVYRTAGQVAELVAERAHEDAVASVPGLPAVYEAQPGWRWGRWLTIGSLVVGLLPVARRRRSVRMAVAVAGVAGSVATKSAVFGAGMASAEDPHLTTAPRKR